MSVESSALDEEQRYQSVAEIDLDGPGSADALIVALHDDSWRVRKAAADRLSQVRAASDAVRKVVGVLGERGQPGARNAAAEALVRIGRPAAPQLVALLSHPDPDQRKFAADILGQMQSPDGELPLVEALDDPDLNVSVSAAEALGQIGGEAACRALMRVLKRPEVLLRLCALEALAYLRRPPPMPDVVPLLSEPKLQRSAYRVLGLIPQPSAIELICKGLQSEVRSIREAAFSALGQQWHSADGTLRVELEAAARSAVRQISSVIQSTVDALESEELDVKAGALFVAAALKDPQLAVPVAEAAHDDRLESEASWVISQLGPASAKTLLLGIQSLSSPARAAITDALVEMADPSWTPALLALLESGEEELQALAIRALSRCQAPEAIGPLVLRLSDPILGASAARALASLGNSFQDAVQVALDASLQATPTPPGIRAYAKVAGPAALVMLRRTLRAADPELRLASAEACVELGAEDCLELVQVALADEVVPVRAAAARALGKLSAAQGAALLERALKDEDPAVQVVGIDAVAESGCEQLVPLLAPWVAHPDGLFAARAIRALARLGHIDAPLLELAGQHADPEVVKEALLSGAAIPEGVTLAVRLLSHPGWDVRSAAARVLGSSGSGACLPQVWAALRDERDPLARAALADAATRLADR